jgi:hypothetical protein
MLVTSAIATCSSLVTTTCLAAVASEDPAATDCNFSDVVGDMGSCADSTVEQRERQGDSPAFVESLALDVRRVFRPLQFMSELLVRDVCGKSSGAFNTASDSFSKLSAVGLLLVRHLDCSLFSWSFASFGLQDVSSVPAEGAGVRKDPKVKDSFGGVLE